MDKPFDAKIMIPLMKRNFKYQFPAYADATNVDVIPGECPVCQADNFWCYTFTFKGEQHTVPAWKKCLECGNKEQSKLATDHAAEKRLNKLITTWYEAQDDEKFGFKNYEVGSNIQLEARDKVRNYVQAICQNSLKNETNLLIQGSTGAGKTHLIKAAARTLKHRGLKVGFVTAQSLFHKFKATFGKVDAEILQIRLYEEMKTLDVLFIDDVGAEAVKLDQEASWAITTWTKIVENRKGLPTVWTTNHDEDQLKRVVGDRAYSRMYEETRFIDMFTADYRKNKAIM